MKIRDVLIKQNRQWRGEEFPYGIERDVKKEVEKFMDTKQVLAITGVRRAGKSYLLFQLMKTQDILPDNILYLNFDDPSLIFLKSDPDALENIYKEYIKLKNPKGKKFLFFDEIQNISNWERWIKITYDLGEDIKFIITGSNATMLSSELSSLLTGRTIRFDVFPFNFREFLEIKKEKVCLSDDLEKIYEKNYSIKDSLNHYFREYLMFGSFPDVVLSEEQAREYILKNYYQDILYKDIIPRFDVRNSKYIEEMSYYLITNISATASYNGIGKLIGIHENTVKQYLSYFEKAYLFFTVPLFSYSLKTQGKNPKKIYCIDTGMRNAVSFRFSEDIGKLTENLVFIELKRRGKEIYYRKENREVDFVVKEGLKVKELIQVCWNPEDEKTKNREVDSLIEAMKEFKLSEGLILTEDYYGEEKIDDLLIKYIPLWVWLLLF
ncbi:conserved hypothetical protein [groundwater metagenome]|uniref:ATPase n=1 Tax=groundwater metagenome TaxID=717931 RepID=A0A098E605_9ZZZZ